MSTGLRAAWAAGEPVFGAWCATASPIAAEALALAGFGYVTVDLQHGLTGLDTLPPVLQGITAAGGVPIVRVPANEAWLIGRALDLGAHGVIVPLVSSAEEARRAAGACRYPPDGWRSYGPVRTSAALGATTSERNERVTCIVMIETREGVESLEAICAVPGVDAVYIGPTDLGLAHGLPPGPELELVVAHIRDTCRRLGMPAGMHARSGEAGRRYVESGFSFASIASDRELVASAGRGELASALGREPDGPGEAHPLRAAVSGRS